MVLTAAEKQRRYREKLKLDPAKYLEYLATQRELNKSKRKKVNTMTNGEHSRAKSQWRARKKKQRDLERVASYRPPTLRNEDTSAPGSPINEATNKARERKVVRRDKAACYRENFKLKIQLADKEKEIKKINTQWEKYRNRAASALHSETSGSASSASGSQE